RRARGVPALTAENTPTSSNESEVHTMAKTRRTIAMDAGDLVAGLRAADSPGGAPDTDMTRAPHPEAQPVPAAESGADSEPEGLGDLPHERTTFHARLETRCPGCRAEMHLEGVRAGRRVSCPNGTCGGGMTIGTRAVTYRADVGRLPEAVTLPA